MVRLGYDSEFFLICAFINLWKEKNNYENVCEIYLWTKNLAKIFIFLLGKSLEEFFAMLSKGPDFTTKMQQFFGRIQQLWTLQHLWSWNWEW